MTDGPRTDDHPKIIQALLALADALLADDVTPDGLAALCSGEAAPVPDGHGHALTLPCLPGVSARLRLAGEQGGPHAATSLSLDSAAPGGSLPMGRSDLEAAFGPGQEGVPMPIERFGARPGPVGVQDNVLFGHAGPGGRVDISATLVKLFGQTERLTALTLTRRRTPGGPASAPRKGLFGWLRR